MLHRLLLLVANNRGVANLRGLGQRALAKGEEATHSPGRWEIEDSRKLLAPIKCTSVILSLVRVSQEKGITRAIQGNMVVCRGGECGQPEGGGVEDTHQHNSVTSVVYRCATIYEVTPLMGPDMCMKKSVQMTQSKKLNANVLIFAR